jgi:hypothetical protein
MILRKYVLPDGIFRAIEPKGNGGDAIPARCILVADVPVQWVLLGSLSMEPGRRGRA